MRCAMAVDAIYITGRSNCSWYRSDDGAIHHIGAGDESSNVANTKATVPWLVFKVNSKYGVDACRRIVMQSALLFKLRQSSTPFLCAYWDARRPIVSLHNGAMW